MQLPAKVNQKQSDSTLAIIFFLLGMPNIYGALRRYSRPNSAAIAIPIKGIGLVSIASVGLLCWVAL